MAYRSNLIWVWPDEMVKAMRVTWYGGEVYMRSVVGGFPIDFTFPVRYHLKISRPSPNTSNDYWPMTKTAKLLLQK